jgi:hypothetical protein
MSVFYGDDKAREAVKGKLMNDETLKSTKQIAMPAIQRPLLLFNIVILFIS